MVPIIDSFFLIFVISVFLNIKSIFLYIKRIYRVADIQKCPLGEWQFNVNPDLIALLTFLEVQLFFHLFVANFVRLLFSVGQLIYRALSMLVQPVCQRLCAQNSADESGEPEPKQ